MDVKLTAFAEALQGFVELTALDLTTLAKTLDARIIDGLENGQAQQFGMMAHINPPKSTGTKPTGSAK
jgi:hypothetical protein